MQDGPTKMSMPHFLEVVNKLCLHGDRDLADVPKVMELRYGNSSEYLHGPNLIR
jgi:hypothetical protein